VARASVATLNHLLGQHAWAKSQLAAHTGKTVRLQLALPRLVFLGEPPDFFASITGAGEFALCEAEQAASVTIELPAFTQALPKLIDQGLGSMQSLARVQGDAQLAMVLGQLFKEMRWDPAEDLAKIVGDVAAQSMVQGGQELATHARSFGQQQAIAARERLVQDQLVSRHELDTFQAELRQLRDTLDRLQQRLSLS
jgi:ubiquinone biosynthesis accessory factor UbiJ